MEKKRRGNHLWAKRKKENGEIRKGKKKRKTSRPSGTYSIPGEKGISSEQRKWFIDKKKKYIDSARLSYEHGKKGEKVDDPGRKGKKKTQYKGKRRNIPCPPL